MKLFRQIKKALSSQERLHLDRPEGVVLFLQSVFVGVVAGLSAVVYRYLISKMEYCRYLLLKDGYTWVFALLLVPIGLILHYALKFAPLSGGSGIPQIRGEVEDAFHMRPVPTWLSKFFGGLVGGFAGLSLGREGPSIQMGGAAAKWICEKLQLPRDRAIEIITAGSAAGLAAAFNAPIAGAIFALEELHKTFEKRIIIPCMVASMSASMVSYRLQGYESSFRFLIREAIPFQYFFQLIIVGIFCGIVGVCFNRFVLFCQTRFRRWRLPRPMQYMFLMGLAFGIAVFFPLITGGGHSLVESVAEAKYDTLYFFVIVLIAKLIYTSICFGSGVPGGIFLPVLVLGAVTGEIGYVFLNHFLPLGPFYANFVILGMSAMLASVVRTPVLAVILVTEMTGTFRHLAPLVLVVMISYYTAEILRTPPIYDSLYERMLAHFNKE